jgi:SAM-dependent methyltransferase
MSIREQMDELYRERPLDEIPWNQAEPPQLLVDLVEAGRLAPCRALDLGCGAGNCAVWLASRGFDVTGVDVSGAALRHARELARNKGVACRFVEADLLDDVTGVGGPFDFACDWEVLHHVLPEDRRRYVANVHRLLRPGGRYLSVCFSEDDPAFGGHGKFRTTSIGTRLYFSSERELEELFAPWFHVDELGTVEVAGKRGPHVVVRGWMRRRSPIDVREAVESDRAFVTGTAARLSAFPVPAWRTPDAIVGAEVRTLESHFDRARPGSRLLIAVGPDGLRMGFVFLEVVEDYFTRQRHGHVGMLAVTAESEGKGAGRALLDAADAWASEQGFTRLTLNVFDANSRARGVYERLGYRPETVRYVKEIGSDPFG